MYERSDQSETGVANITKTTENLSTRENCKHANRADEEKTIKINAREYENNRF